MTTVVDGEEIHTSLADLHATDYNYLVILPQTKIEAILIRKLAEMGVAVERGVEVLRFDQNEGSVEVSSFGRNEIHRICYVQGKVTLLCYSNSGDSRVIPMFPMKILLVLIKS